MKKWLYRMDIPAVVLALLALVSMSFAMFSTSLSGALASETIPVCGFNLTQFTPWGYVVQMAPLAIIALCLAHRQISHKYLLLFGILTAALFGYNDGMIVAKEWLIMLGEKYVSSRRVIFFYPLFLMVSSIMLTTHMYCSDNFAELKKEFPEDFEPDMEYYEFIAESEKEACIVED